MGEDESNMAPSKWIATLGLQRKLATPSHRFEWTAEGSDTRLGHLFGLRPEKREPAYQHSIYRDGHYHQGLPIDSPSALRFEARLWSARVSQHGSEPINAAYGRPGRTDGLLPQGAGVMRMLRWRLGLAVQHSPERAQSGRRSVGLIGAIEVPLQMP